MVGAWLDQWIPRLLQILGLVGVALALIQFAVSGEFQPLLFGGSLGAASGGSVIDAARASKNISRSLKNGDVAT